MHPRRTADPIRRDVGAGQRRGSPLAGLELDDFQGLAGLLSASIGEAGRDGTAGRQPRLLRSAPTATRPCCVADARPRHRRIRGAAAVRSNPYTLGVGVRASRSGWGTATRSSATARSVRLARRPLHRNDHRSPGSTAQTVRAVARRRTQDGSNVRVMPGGDGCPPIAVRRGHASGDDPLCRSRPRHEPGRDGRHPTGGHADARSAPPARLRHRESNSRAQIAVATSSRSPPTSGTPAVARSSSTASAADARTSWTRTSTSSTADGNQVAHARSARWRGTAERTPSLALQGLRPYRLLDSASRPSSAAARRRSASPTPTPSTTRCRVPTGIPKDRSRDGLRRRTAHWPCERCSTPGQATPTSRDVPGTVVRHHVVAERHLLHRGQPPIRRDRLTESST